MISSELINPPNVTEIPLHNLFVFGGFCLVAAISSRAFIQTISQQILKQAENAAKKADEAKKEVKEVRDTAEAIVSSQAESDDETTDEKTGGSANFAQRPKDTENNLEQIYGLGHEEKQVLRALTTSEYTFRTISGISKDTQLDKGRTNTILVRMMICGLAGRTVGKSGRLLWFATTEGRRAAEVFSESPNKK